MGKSLPYTYIIRGENIEKNNCNYTWRAAQSDTAARSFVFDFFIESPTKKQGRKNGVAKAEGYTVSD